MRTKTIGLTLLGLSVGSVVGAGVLGVTAATEGWAPERVVGATALLAAFAETTFWAGAGTLGLGMAGRARQGRTAFGLGRLLRRKGSRF